MLLLPRHLRGAAAALGLILAAWPVSAQQVIRDPRADRNFDIRDEMERPAPAGAAAKLAPPDRARDRALIERRKASVEAYRASSAAQGIRIVLNDFGLPKSLFHPLRPMTAPSSRDPESIARDFLSANREILPVDAASSENFRLYSRHSAADGLSFLQFQQTYRGVDVFHGQVNLALNSAGQVVQASAGDVLTQLNLSAEPKLTPEQILARAFQMLEIEAPLAWDQLPTVQTGKTRFGNPNGPNNTDITTELFIFPLSPTSAVLAYRIFLEVDGARWYDMLLDAEEGHLLARYNLYAYAAKGRVWTEYPQKAARELVTFPDAWLPADGTVTTGNNVDAYLDADGNNQPDTAAAPNILNGRAVSATRTFDFDAGEGTTSQDPRVSKAAAVTSLFYFVNLAHDYFYGLGFNEEAGNFQEGNAGKGGVGGDSVRAEAQDGATFNNANFGTPPEGTQPRMQLGIFTRGTSLATDDLDADYDGPTIIHEYGHGVSNRLVGGGAGGCLFGTQSGAMGEGWSDYFAISYFNNPVFSPYPDQNRYRGPRRQGYDNNRLTYEDLGEEFYEVHDDGEVWGGVLWDIRKAVGQAVADKLVMNGLKLTPCKPSMIDARGDSDSEPMAPLFDFCGLSGLEYFPEGRTFFWSPLLRLVIHVHAQEIDVHVRPGGLPDRHSRRRSDIHPNRIRSDRPIVRRPARRKGANHGAGVTEIERIPAGGLRRVLVNPNPAGLRFALAGLLPVVAQRHHRVDRCSGRNTSARVSLNVRLEIEVAAIRPILDL